MGLAILTGALSTAALAWPAHGYISYFPTMQKLESGRNPDCMTEACPDLPLSEMHPREIKAIDAFSCSKASFYEKYFKGVSRDQEYLRFRKDNPLQKFFIFSSAFDHNGALDPTRIGHLVSSIVEKFDVKYKVIYTFEQMCEGITNSSKAGVITNVLIHGHSNENGVCISDQASLENWIHKDRDFSKCFKGLEPDGKIIFLGSDIGKNIDGKLNSSLAQRIATLAKRMVIAAVDTVFPSQVEAVNLDDFEVYQKNGWALKNNNVFKAFYPLYEECTKPSPFIHPREEALMETIKESRLARSYLLKPDNFDDLNDVLGFCAADPRQKFLFLSATFDDEGALDPDLNPDLFYKLSKTYDFKFAVVSNLKDIRREFEEAAKTGVFLNVVLNAHGRDDYIRIGEENNNVIMDNDDIASCMTGLNLQGKITLISCYNADELIHPNQVNIATRVAQVTQRSVVAADEESFNRRIKVISIKPFDIFHPSENDQSKNIYKTIKAKSND